jgi:uracil-DNA glycosylase
MSRAARDPDAPAPPIPARPSLASLRKAAQECRACGLWEGATQAVIGEGAANARSEVFLSNVVKHFRYRARGKRRIHQPPSPPIRRRSCGRATTPSATTRWTCS